MKKKINLPHGDKFVKIASLAPILTLLTIVVLGQAWPSEDLQVTPDIPFSVVYYWSVFRREAPLPITFFLIGLMEDSFTGAPIGFTSLLWLCIYFVTLTQRRFLLERTFPIVWVGFAFVCLVAFSIKYWVMGFFVINSVSIYPILFSYFFTVGIYPVLALGLSLFNKEEDHAKV